MSFLALFLVDVAAAADFPRSADLCVLPIFRGSPGELDEFELKRMVRRLVLPWGLSGPVIYNMRRTGPGVWTVAGGTFQSFGGPFPESGDTDRFVVDARTGRIIGLNARAEIFAAEAGTRVFRRLGSPKLDGKPVHAALSYLPYRQAVMFGYENKIYRLEGDEFVLVTDKLPFPFFVGGAIAIDDLPKLDAMLVTTGAGGIVVVHDNGEIEVIQEPKPGSYSAAPTVVELPDPPRVLVRTIDKILVFPQTRPAPQRVVPHLLRLDVHVAAQANQTSTVTGVYLLPSMTGLWRVGPQGYERVPGGEKIYGTARLYDAATLGIAVVSGEGVLWAFDGNSLNPIPDSGIDRIGPVNGVHDLRSIGKVLVAGTKGLFELTPQRTLVPISLPMPPDSDGIRIVEMPRSRAAIVLVANSAYAVEQDGVLRTLHGGDDLGFPAYPGSKPIGLVSPTNELLFEGPGSMSLFRVIDRRTAGDEACASTERPRPPASALCFRQVAVTDKWTFGSFSDWAMSPEGDRLLVLSTKGLLQIAKDRSFGRVPDLGPEYRGKPIEVPWDGGAFIAAVGTSPSVILEKSGRLRPVQDERQGRSDTFTRGVALPSLETLVLGIGIGSAFSGHGYSYTHYLGPDDTIARIKDERGKAVVLNWPPLETPWLGGALVYYLGPKLFKPGGPLAPLSLEGNSRRQINAMQYLNGYPTALSRFRFVLMATRDGWKRLTEDRQIEDVPGIDPATSYILSIVDPGRGDMLLGTLDGLYRINEQGVASPIPEAGTGAVRVIQQSSALGGFIVGGENGLFRVVDGSRVVALEQGDAMTIGAVFRVVDVPWARLTLIAAARGFFVLDRDGALTRLDTSAIGGKSPFQRLSAFAAMQGVFVFGATYGQDKGAIYELGRPAGAGSCTAPL